MEIALNEGAECAKLYDVYFEVLFLRIMRLKNYSKIERKKYSAEIALIPNALFPLHDKETMEMFELVK